MKRGTPEYAEARREQIKRADEQLALAYSSMDLQGLRWDWGCNISLRSREILRAELERRGVSVSQFEAMGRGRRAQ